MYQLQGRYLQNQVGWSPLVAAAWSETTVTPCHVFVGNHMASGGHRGDRQPLQRWHQLSAALSPGAGCRVSIEEWDGRVPL